jgi:hypothetical protein
MYCELSSICTKKYEKYNYEYKLTKETFRNYAAGISILNLVTFIKTTLSNRLRTMSTGKEIQKENISNKRIGC